MKAILSLYLLLTAPLTANENWLPREIHEVRAYVYDYTQEPNNLSLLNQGKLHTGIINDGGAKLTEEQIERLNEALRPQKPKDNFPSPSCYMPHHGFIFFDKKGKAMGHIELCFQCGTADRSPKGIPKRGWNWLEIRKILEELEIPILKEDKDYTALYSEKNAKKK